MTKFEWSLLLSTTVTALLAGNPATAQSSREPGSSASAAGAELGEILVMARRREEKLQDVPLSVTAVDADQLLSRGVVQTADLAAIVPNLKINSQYGDTQPNFSLRGVGVANEFNSNTASPIGVYIDEVYQAFRFTHGLSLYDLDRVEVLRGPQGTLFGRNTTGGAVSLYTRDPELAGTAGYLSVGYGNYDRKKTQGAFEFTPIDHRVGVRLAFTRSKGDGYWNEKDPAGTRNGLRDYATSDNTGVRGTVRIKASDQLDINLKGYYSKDDPSGSPIFARGVMGGIPGTNFFGYSREADGLDYDDYHLDSHDQFYSRAGGVVLRLNYEVSDALAFTSVTGYADGRYVLQTDNDGSPQDIFVAKYRSNTTDFNQDLRLSFTRDRLQLLLGAYYGKDKADALNFVHAFNVFPDASSPLNWNPGGLVDPSAAVTSLNTQYGYEQRRESYAFYGEGSYGLTDALELTLGLRYTHDKLEFRDAFSNAYDDLPGFDTVSGTTLFPLYTPFSLKETDDNVSGRVILNYKWTDDIGTYVSYSRGYRSGAYNGFAYINPSQVYFLKPEKLDSYEAGFKTRLWNDRVQFNGAVFHYKYVNQQVQEIVQAVGFLRSVNAKVDGVELELLAKPVDILTVRASLGFLDSKYKKNQFLSGLDIGGNRLPFASRWTADLGGDLTVARMTTGEIVASAEVSYVSKYFYDMFNEDAPGYLNTLEQPGAAGYMTQKGYALVNARLSFVSDHFSVAAWAKNLTNKKYFPVGYDVTGAFGNTIYTAGAPRTYGLEATVKF